MLLVTVLLLYALIPSVQIHNKTVISQFFSLPALLQLGLIINLGYHTMPWRRLASESVLCQPEHVANAVQVWLHRPNVCSKVISCASVELAEGDSHQRLTEEALSVLESIKAIHASEQFKTFLRQLVPKKPDIYMTCNELVIMSPHSATFIPLSMGHDGFEMAQLWYSITCINARERWKTESKHVKALNHGESGGDLEHVLEIYVYGTSDFEDLHSVREDQENLDLDHVSSDSMQTALRSCFPTEIWLKEKLFPQLVKWSLDEAARTSDGSGQRKLDLPPSLSLITQHKYAAKYHSLKQKYGTEMMKNWTEVTDPQKYVYEDVAIATYLILLWEKERAIASSQRLQSFIDFGCGNGLLVHILNSEGHPGRGVDIRKRNIWDAYPPSTNLVEGIVDPMDGVAYAEFDWLLGNHSDELTPWIPVLAARSGYHVRYWVLPCCFFDFFGKYERSQSTLGQYGDYLNFVRDVGVACGFDTQVDVMRIPSTKRVCHVGMTKSYPEEEHQNVLEKIEKYIEDRKLVAPYQGGHFVARERTEKVRNCTKMDRSIQDSVVSLITKRLLQETNNIEVEVGGVCKSWNRGGCVPLEDVIAWIDTDVRKLMKSEYGGLQTLLRNHHQIFEIRNGKVQIRDWGTADKKKPGRSEPGKKTNARKTKQCWFHQTHPDGCPRTVEECPFLHGENDVNM